ncbi:hypothetical protein BH11BAC5_BH11BAC5_34050 [soil metagenome]
MADEQFTIKENSWLAKLAAKKLNTSAVAMVIGSTIHLHNTATSEFLKDTRWVKHELCHIRQYKQHGTMGFIVKYLWESLKKGYYNNRFEVEARAAENE